MNEQVANQIFDILITDAGAKDGTMRESFVAYFTDPADFVREFRFMGTLGFGGKCWFDRFRRNPVHVSCYPDERTDRRDKTIAIVNAKLASLWQEVSK